MRSTVKSSAWVRKTVARSTKTIARASKGKVRPASKGQGSPVKVSPKRARTIVRQTERQFRRNRTKAVYSGLARDINRAQSGGKVVNDKTRKVVWAGVKTNSATPKVEKALKAGIRTGERQAAVSKFLANSRAVVDVEGAAKALKTKNQSPKKNPQAFDAEIRKRIKARTQRQKRVRRYQKRQIEKQAAARIAGRPMPTKPKPKPKNDGPDYSGGTLSDIGQFLTKANIPGTKALGEANEKIAESKVGRVLNPQGYVASKIGGALGYNDGINPLEAAAVIPAGKAVQVASKAPKAATKAPSVVARAKSALGISKAPKTAPQKVSRSNAGSVPTKPKPKPKPKKQPSKAKKTVARAKTTKQKAKQKVAQSAPGQAATKVSQSKTGQTVKAVTQGKAAPKGKPPTTTLGKVQNWRATSKNLAKYRKARKYTRRAGAGYLAAATAGKPLDANLPGENIVPGTLKANPVVSAKKTAEIIPSLFTGAITDAKNIGRTGVRGARDVMAEVGIPGGKDYTKDQVLYPAKATVDANIDFLKKMADVYLTGTTEDVKKFTEEDMGYWGIGMLAPQLREPIGDVRKAARPRLREAAKERRDRTREAAMKGDVTRRKSLEPIQDSRPPEQRLAEAKKASFDRSDTVEYVPVAELMRLRDIDRTPGKKSAERNRAEFEKFKKALANGEKGVSDPVVIDYSPETGKVLLAEGNNRVTAAAELGLEFLPAKVMLNSRAKRGKWAITQPYSKWTTKPPADYIPSNLRPHEIGLTGHRETTVEDFSPRPDRPIKPRNPIDRKTGEEYVFRRVGNMIENRRDRVAQSRDVARELDAAEMSAQDIGQSVTRNLRRSKLTGRSVRKANRGVDAADALQTVVAFGISRDRGKAARQIQRIRAKGRDANVAIAGKKTDKDALDFIERNPAIFEDANFWNAVDEFKRFQDQDGINRSMHKRLRLLGDLFGIAPPERVIVAAGKKRGWGRSGKEVMPETVRKWRRDAAEYRRQAATKTGKDRKLLIDKAKKLEKRREDYIKISRKAYADYNKKVNERRKKEGFELPAYVAQVDIDYLDNRLQSGPAFPANRMSEKTKKFENKQGGVADRSFEVLMERSIQAPRRRQALNRLTRAFASNQAIPINGRAVVTTRDVQEAVKRGEINNDEHVVMHAQHFKAAALDYGSKQSEEAFDDYRGALEGAKYSIDDIARAAIGSEARKGHKYIVVRKAALKEYEAQLGPGSKFGRVVGAPGRALSSLILGTSVSWAVSQAVADAIPLMFTQGLSPAGMARIAKAAHAVAKEWDTLSDKEKIAIRSTVGESIGANGYVVNFGLSKGELRTKWHETVGDFWRVSDGNDASVGRFLVGAAKGISTIERKRAGKYRQVAAIALTDKAVSEAVVGLGNLLKLEKEISEKLVEMPPAKRVAYIAQHPEYGRRLEQALNDNMGSWRAMTSREREIAPLLIFYPFMRFSLRWVLNTFPKNHPNVASVNAFLAIQNHNELEKLLGGPPGFFADWATGIDYNAPGDVSFTEYRRVAPGSNALIEAVGDNKSPLRALNPAVGGAIAAFNNVDPLTGEQYDGKNSMLDVPGRLASNFFGGVTPFRLADEVIRGDGKRRNRATAPIIGEFEDPSWIAQVFEKLNPRRDLRSFAVPFVPHKGSQYKQMQQASRWAKAWFDAPTREDLEAMLVKKDGKADSEYRAELEKYRRGQKARVQFEALARSLGINPDGSKKTQRIKDKASRDYTNVGKAYQQPELGDSGLSGSGGLSRRGL